MRKRDITGVGRGGELGPTRSEEVYRILSDMLDQQVGQGWGPNDRVSLVEMSTTASVVYSRVQGGAVAAAAIRRHGRQAKPREHGNYIPALRCVLELMAPDVGGTHGVSVLFLSDGKPSDAAPRGTCDPMSKTAAMICAELDGLTARMGKHRTDFYTMVRVGGDGGCGWGVELWRCEGVGGVEVWRGWMRRMDRAWCVWYGPVNVIVSRSAFTAVRLTRTRVHVAH